MLANRQRKSILELSNRHGHTTLFTMKVLEEQFHFGLRYNTIKGKLNVNNNWRHGEK